MDILSFLPEFIVVIAAIIQIRVIRQHWVLGTRFGLITSFTLYAIGFSTMLLPRILTMVFFHMGGGDTYALNMLNSLIYLFNALVFLNASLGLNRIFKVE